MSLARKYSVADVRSFVEMFRNSPDISRDRFLGMEDVVGILAHFEKMSDQEIEEETRSAYRSITL